MQSDNQCAPLIKRANENRIAKNQTIICMRKRFVVDNDFDDRLIIVDINRDQIRLTTVCSPGQLEVRNRNKYPLNLIKEKFH